MQIRYAQRFGCRCSRWRTSRGEMRASGDSSRNNWSATYRCHSDGSCASAAAPRLTHANEASDRASTKVRRWCRLSSGSRSREESGSSSDDEPSAAGGNSTPSSPVFVRQPSLLSASSRRGRASCGAAMSRAAVVRPRCSSAPTASTPPAGSRKRERVLHRVASLHPSLPGAYGRLAELTGELAHLRAAADVAPTDARDAVLAAYALNRVGAPSEALVYLAARGASRAGERAAAKRARRDGARRRRVCRVARSVPRGDRGVADECGGVQ